MTNLEVLSNPKCVKRYRNTNERIDGRNVQAKMNGEMSDVACAEEKRRLTSK
jgi:hypothetical protein